MASSAGTLAGPTRLVGLMRRYASGLALVFACSGAPPVTTESPAARPAAATATAPAAADSAPTVLTPAQIERDRATAVKVAPIVDAFINVAPHLLRDGRVVYTSNRDGLPALYVADPREPAAPPRKLPTSDERVAGTAVLPDESAVLFLSDVKADGNYRIFRVAIDGGDSARVLTPGESLHRDAPNVARGVPGLFSYSANLVSDRTARVFVQRADGTPPREVYRDPRSGTAIDMTPDGRHILFSQFRSQNEQVLFEIEVASGKARRLYPAEGQTPLLSGAAYSADGRRIFVAAAVEGRPPWLVTLDRRTGREVGRYEEKKVPTGTIADLQVSPRGDRLVVAIDAGHHSEVRLLDARSLRPIRTVETGLGAAFPGPFRADGKSFSLVLSRPDAPTDIHAVDVRTGAITPLRAERRPGSADAPPIASSIAEVPAFDGLTIPVNLYLPEEQTRGKSKLPTVVLVHGGPSSSAYASFNPEVRVLSSMGFAVVQPNIRGSTGFGLAYEKADDREKRGDALRDIETVNTWARAQPWCDGRLVIMGGSYGGYMTLLALTRQPAIWQAGVDNSGMSDLKTMEELEDQTIRAYDETEFGALGAENALLAEWSPLHDMSKITAPVFIYQGANDPVTPREQADRMVQALRARKVPVEYMLLADEGHGVVRR
ncbi:MAG TPA: prolyl oligopeptidase family serine peptidase, partial [Kofleriaceae bacterium]|nr:prolyl oligopeptidase family serine peptidase [Kofleriaceae bacterium]